MEIPSFRSSILTYTLISMFFSSESIRRITIYHFASFLNGFFHRIEIHVEFDMETYVEIHPNPCGIPYGNPFENPPNFMLTHVEMNMEIHCHMICSFLFPGHQSDAMDTQENFSIR